MFPRYSLDEIEINIRLSIFIILVDGSISLQNFWLLFQRKEIETNW